MSVKSPHPHPRTGTVSICTTCYGQLQAMLTQFKTENVRLRDELKVARHHWQACEVGWNKVIKQVEGFVALAERFATALHYKDVHELTFKDCPYRICQEARATIEEAGK
ncbi:hypothetical protein LCGC14_2568160 [marine sediment metagenome]|uniref:Uncharacterized protein n=1 Tax=marine sediment metagenome TaxID=412755 RepID=A0A0F9CU62_9ZZZZ